MQPWAANSQSHVGCMRSGDLFANEKSVCVDVACDVKVELVTADRKRRSRSRLARCWTRPS